jgi:hypothetical protein
MRPTIISATIQEFDGVRYYRCGYYFQHKGEKLHHAVWRYHRGPIPAGYHMHHRDNDRSNNTIGNLQCLTVKEHLGGRHGHESAEKWRRAQPKASAAAVSWHRSEEGRRWHAQHRQNLIGRKQPRVPAKCQQCGADFMAPAAQLGYAKFCGPNCKAKDFRRRHRSK